MEKERNCTITDIELSSKGEVWGLYGEGIHSKIETGSETEIKKKKSK